MGLERILIVDDELTIRKALEERLRRRRFAVATAATAADAEKYLAAGDGFDLVLLDMHLPDGDGHSLLQRIMAGPEPPMVIMITAHASIESAVECIRAGAFDYIIKPFSTGQIEMAIKKAEDFNRVVKVNAYLNKEQAKRRELFGESQTLMKLRHLIGRVARTDATVLICGENGTGKEMVANEIFLNSSRAGAPFIKVNCAAISETLIESEFFGHEKGAFTGATERRDGRFELANTGTLLLDEISEIPMPLQAKLLRVLQEKEFERVGGNKTIKVDVRVLATTNRDLVRAVERGEFREDLYYRLNVFPLYVPPLREREGDILLLADRFLERQGRQHGLKLAGFSPEAREALRHHGWPGNVRELQNVIERAAILAEEGVPIDVEVLGLLPPVSLRSRTAAGAPVTPAAPAPTPAAAAASPAPSSAGDAEILPLEEMEKRCILAALDKTGGNRTHAANLLKISIRTLRNKLHQYRIDSAADAESGPASEAAE